MVVNVVVVDAVGISIRSSSSSSRRSSLVVEH